MALQLLQARADQTDAIITDMQRTLDELKAQGVGAGAPLSNDDRAYITKKLKSIRQQVVAEEKQIEDQQKIIKNYEVTLTAVKSKVKTELTNIKKQLLVESARANPEEFRNEVAKRLREIRAALVAQQGAGGSGDVIPPQIAAKIVADLKKIRAEVLKKEQNEATFRSELKKRLLALRKDVEKIEQENERLKSGGGKIPPQLQAVLVRKLQEIKKDVFNLEAENLRLKAAADPDPLMNLQTEKVMSVVDMHCGGEPLRIVQSGIPDLEGATILAKRQFFQQNLDEYRQALLAEPRGHYDMYGAVITEADEKEADFGVIFLTNDGYSVSCGHATLCLGRYAVDFGKVTVEPDADTVTVRIQAPCGLLEVEVAVKNGKSTGEARYVSTPSFVEKIGQEVQTPGGPVEVDIAFGGTYYAIVEASRLNLQINQANLGQLISRANEITNAVKAKVQLTNPGSADLAFLYGTVVTDGNKNLTVFADKQVDRCPTGSAVQALLAVLFAKNDVGLNDPREFTSITSSVMVGMVTEEANVGGKQAVRVQVRGTSRYTGKSTLYVEANDELRAGFYLR